MKQSSTWLPFLLMALFYIGGCASTQHPQKRAMPSGQSWDKPVHLKTGVQTPSLGMRLVQMNNVFENMESPPLKWTLFVNENALRLPDGTRIALSLKDGAIHLPPSDRMESPRGIIIQSAYEPLRKLFLDTVGELGGHAKRPLFIITDERISADLVGALSATGRMAGFGAPIWVGADPESLPVGFVLQGPKPCEPSIPPVLPPPIKEPDGYTHHRMAIGRASIAGQCNPIQLEPIFAQWTEALDQCYAQAAEDYPNLIGQYELANISILLNPSGTVAATAFDGRWSNQHPSLSRCIQNTMRAKQYPVSEGYCLLSRTLHFSFSHHLDVHHGAPPPAPHDFTNKVSWARVHLYRDATKLQLGIQETGTACSRGIPAFITLKIKDPEAIVRWVDTLTGAGKRKLETLHIRAETSAKLKDVLRIAESLIQQAGRTQLRFSVVETELP